MSHEITESDTPIYAGKPAWHGLGTVLPERVTALEARKLALPWDPIPGDITVNGTKIESHKAVVRNDNNAVIGVVGADYTILSNGEFFDIIQECLTPDVRIETAGSLKGGKEIWALCALDHFKIGPNGDEVAPFCLWTTAHDGSRRFRGLPTTVRVECNNMLRLALARGASSGISVKHTSGMRQEIESAKRELLLVEKKLDTFKEQADALSRKTWTADESMTFFAKVYEKLIAPIPRKVTTEAEKKRADDAADMVSRWARNVDHGTNMGIRGTAWGALNAVTQWSTHDRRNRVTDNFGSKAEAQTYSNWLGAAGDDTFEALNVALEAIA